MMEWGKKRTASVLRRSGGDEAKLLTVGAALAGRRVEGREGLVWS